MKTEFGCIAYVIPRIWFDKTNGNTYHSVDVLAIKNGYTVTGFKVEYGYDTQYKYTAKDVVEELGFNAKKTTFVFCALTKVSTKQQLNTPVLRDRLFQSWRDDHFSC